MNDLNPQRAAITFSVYSNSKGLAENVHEHETVRAYLDLHGISYKELHYYPQANSLGGRLPVPSFLVDYSYRVTVLEILKSYGSPAFLEFDPFRVVTKHFPLSGEFHTVGVLKLTDKKDLEGSDRYFHDLKYGTIYRIAHDRETSHEKSAS